MDVDAGGDVSEHYTVLFAEDICPLEQIMCGDVCFCAYVVSGGSVTVAFFLSEILLTLVIRVCLVIAVEVRSKISRCAVYFIVCTYKTVLLNQSNTIN